MLLVQRCVQSLLVSSGDFKACPTSRMDFFELIMKKLFITLFISVLALGSASAQEEDERIRDKSVSLELLGPSVLVGATYDARFKPDSKWGYRAGVGYAFLNTLGAFGGSDRQYAVMMPLGVNYLQGESKGKLELGAGVSLGLAHESRPGYHYSYFEGNGEDLHEVHFDQEGISKTEFGYFFYGNIGYRRISKNGFQFRCGISPIFNINKKDFDFDIFWPYVSFGYAF